MHYKAPDNSIHVIEPEFAHMLPPGCVAITVEEADSLRPRPDAAAITEAKKAGVREVRETVLNRLAGIALAAQLSGDTDTTKAYVIVRSGLLDITNALPDDVEQIDDTVQRRYAALAAQCTPSMTTALPSALGTLG